MTYITHCDSPVGTLLLASDGENLIGLWLEGQKHYGNGLDDAVVTEDSLPIFSRTKRWLEAYFAGEQPSIEGLPLAPGGSEFRRRICRLMCEIPYGELTTYGQLAKNYEVRFGKKTSARAVGGAVGRNPISILIPCHRVVGAGGITGYAGGLAKKRILLELEGITGY